jgi:SpoVK/Ycf46/Vps4 family AAA+-type ATPase
MNDIERNKIMKIIETGTTYKVYGEDLVVLDNLPAQTYKVGFSQFTGFFLEKQHDLEIKEDKIYGFHEEKANKVLNRFEKSRKNLGVILSGDKGIGKSLFARLLAQKAIRNGIPVILVDNFIPGIDDFLNDIKNEVLVLFDEFDKTFARSKDEDPQSKMLSLFDGTSSGKKLFVVTCNNYRDLNEYLINRPGRFHFHFRFEYPTADEVKDYLRDKLNEKYHSEINKVASFSRKIKLNYDCLSAIAIELNEGETFEDAIKDLNIINTSERENRYNIKLFTEEGIIFTADNETLDLFSGENNSLWVDDVAGNSVRLKFKGNSVIFDNKTNVFSVSNDKINITYDDDYLEDDVKDMYKKLHYTYAEITLNYGNRIHYNLV